MQENRGIAKVLIIGVVVLLITAIAMSVILITKDEELDAYQVQVDIEKSLAIDERANGIVAENVVVTNISGDFARGKLTDTSSSEEKDFYMIKIAGVWRVVEITNSPVSCERFARIGFPNVFIQDCRLSFSDAVTLSEIDATLADFFLSSQNVNLKIIGTVENVTETENGQIITVNSGGEFIQIQLGPNEVVEEGDLVVTSITPPNQNNTSSTENNSQTVYNSNNTVVVNNPDKDLFVDLNPILNPNNPVIDNNSTLDEDNKVYKIDAPKSSAPPSYFFNVKDLDNSRVNVELDGSF